MQFRRLWNFPSMIRTTGTVFFHLASLASIIGLYFTLYPVSGAQPGWHVVLLTLVALAFLGFSFWEVFSDLKVARLRHKPNT